LKNIKSDIWNWKAAQISTGHWWTLGIHGLRMQGPIVMSDKLVVSTKMAENVVLLQV